MKGTFRSLLSFPVARRGFSPGERPGTRFRTLRRAGWIALALGIPCISSASELSGRLTLEENGKDRTRQESRFAVVYYTPAEKPTVRPLEEPATVTMTRKQFMPRIQAVPVGTAVDFPNDDGIIHNVFSLSGKNRFDLGLYRRGESRQAVLDAPGVVQIFCNVHHSMVAYVLALETPFYTMPDREGHFDLSGLPDGPGTLTIWHERSQPQVLKLDSPALRDLEIHLDITKPRVPPHRNKFGKPYSRKRRGKAY